MSKQSSHFVRMSSYGWMKALILSIYLAYIHLGINIKLPIYQSIYITYIKIYLTIVVILKEDGILSRRI